MKKRNVKIINIMLACAAAVLIVLLTIWGFIVMRDNYTKGGVLHICAWITAIAFAIAVMAGALRVSLRKTIYSYSNAGLIGGMLFAGVYLLSLLSVLIDCTARGLFLTRNALFNMLINSPKRFISLAFPVISIICLLLFISNISLIRHEGMHLHNLMSVILAGFYLGGTLVLVIASEFIYYRVLVPSGITESRIFIILYTFIPLFLQTVLCYFECIMAGFCVMGKIAADHIPSHDRDFVIILGCSIDRRGGLLPLLKARTNRAYRFGWEQEIDTGKPVIYVPSGGQGANEIISEGSAMELYLLSHGAEENEVIAEKKSRNTYENMLFSKKIIDSVKPDAKVAFATTNYHVYRSGILARMAGLDAEGISSTTKWYFWPNGFVREFFATLALKKKAHFIFMAVTAVLCVLLGAAAWIFGLM